MKSLLLACALALAGSAPALAADLQAPPIASIYDWSGAYVGAHLGYGWSRSKWEAPGGLFNNRSGTGLLGGIQAGYDFQTGNWVYGVEASIAAADVKKSVTCINPTLSCGTEITWLADVSGRLGYAFDRALVFGTAGVAFAGDKNYARSVSDGSSVFTGSETRVGWTLGAGVAYAFTNNISATFQYNYYDLGAKTNAMTTVGGGASDATYRRALTANAIKLGINYRF